MDYVECPECGRAYTWTYIYSGFQAAPVLKQEHTIVCHCGTDFDFVVYEDLEEEDLTESIEEFVDSRWWTFWGRTKQVVVTGASPRLYQVYQIRDD
ncbi:hypothetical protein LCGC14_0458180 [marine sediment metagenome]|uniref:Uncharacterized protein n=1 Tax=marine sediment metagenome TaxID=412755 RepID=A0A0F9SFZ9_9ZZZZ